MKSLVNTNSKQLFWWVHALSMYVQIYVSVNVWVDVCVNTYYFLIFILFSKLQMGSLSSFLQTSDSNTAKLQLGSPLFLVFFLTFVLSLLLYWLIGIWSFLLEMISEGKVKSSRTISTNNAKCKGFCVISLGICYLGQKRMPFQKNM